MTAIRPLAAVTWRTSTGAPSSGSGSPAAFVRLNEPGAAIAEAGETLVACRSQAPDASRSNSASTAASHRPAAVPRDDDRRAIGGRAAHSTTSPPRRLPSPASIQYSTSRSRSASAPVVSSRTIQASRRVSAGASGRPGSQVSFGATQASSVATTRRAPASLPKRSSTILAAAARATPSPIRPNGCGGEGALHPGQAVEGPVAPERDANAVAEHRHAVDDSRPRDRPAAGTGGPGDDRRAGNGQAGPGCDLEPAGGGGVAPDGPTTPGLPPERQGHHDLAVEVEATDRDLAAGCIGRHDLVVDAVLEPIVEALCTAVHAGEVERLGKLGRAGERPLGLGRGDGDGPGRPAARNEGVRALTRRRAGENEATADDCQEGQAERAVVAHRRPPNCSSRRRSTARASRTSGRCPTSRHRRPRG